MHASQFPHDPFTMCFHSQHIWMACGHSLLSPQPIARCRQASATNRFGPSTSTCTPTTHPYQTWRIETLCPACEGERDRRLSELAKPPAVQFDEWRWRVSYAMPSTGKDFWGRKADERENTRQETQRSTAFARPKGELRRRALRSVRRSKERDQTDSKGKRS